MRVSARSPCASPTQLPAGAPLRLHRRRRCCTAAPSPALPACPPVHLGLVARGAAPVARVPRAQLGADADGGPHAQAPRRTQQQVQLAAGRGVQRFAGRAAGYGRWRLPGWLRPPAAASRHAVAAAAASCRQSPPDSRPHLYCSITTMAFMPSSRQCSTCGGGPRQRSGRRVGHAAAGLTLRGTRQLPGAQGTAAARASEAAGREAARTRPGGKPSSTRAAARGSTAPDRSPLTAPAPPPSPQHPPAPCIRGPSGRCRPG